jgi:DNA-binding MarR family transcriptional regulator
MPGAPAIRTTCDDIPPGTSVGSQTVLSSQPHYRLGPSPQPTLTTDWHSNVARNNPHRNGAKDTHLGVLPNLIGYHLRLAQIALFRDFAAAVGDYDITPTLFGALALIEANPGMKQTDLARAIQLDRSSVVSVINKLERQGLVVRRRAIKDRRSTSLELTAAGQRLLDHVRPMVLEHERRITDHFTPAEQTQLIELLGRICPHQR